MTTSIGASRPFRPFTLRAAGGVAFALAWSVAGCAADVAGPTGTEAKDTETHDENVARAEEGWDSQAGNPTHATHSYLTEYAVDQLSPYYPELATYRAQLVDGANQELHELPISGNAEEEALRQEAGGTNWAANHPEVIWEHARTSYASGDKKKAYWYVGIVLHWVEDMGVPAHAFHVIHQGTLSQRDNFELLGLQRWAPKYDAMNRTYPGLAAPSDYVIWNGAWTMADFNQTFPGTAYDTRFFASSWLWASSTQSTFVRNREGRTAVAAYWALYSAASQL